MKKEELRNWISAYIRYQEIENNVSEDNPDWWAVQKFFDLGPDHPEFCWKAILGILGQKPNNSVIQILAAGPLEDLIEDHGEKYIDEIEDEAKRDPDFKHLLGGVWESSTPEVWSRILKARDNKSW